MIFILFFLWLFWNGFKAIIYIIGGADIMWKLHKKGY